MNFILHYKLQNFSQTQKPPTLNPFISHIYRKAAATRPAAAAAISKLLATRPAAAVTWRVPELVVVAPAVTVPTEVFPTEDAGTVAVALARVEAPAVW